MDNIVAYACIYNLFILGYWVFKWRKAEFARIMESLKEHLEKEKEQ